MTKLKAWLGAARLRTLPLSVSGIIIGSLLGFKAINNNCPGGYFQLNIDCPAMQQSIWSSLIFWLAIATTVGFQVISNFANDYGDGIKGTDSKRLGEKRAVASGEISPQIMKKGIFITSMITLLIATLLIYISLWNENWVMFLVFFLLGLASVAAAIKYTVGSDAYGYSGYGDIFVFLFFGILSVLGSYFLFTKTINWEMVLPAISVGVFSVAVLNLNNMRDIGQDEIHNKNTLVVKLGIEKAKIYHYLLILCGISSALIYSAINYYSPIQFGYLIAFIPMLLNLKTVFLNQESRLLDAELKKVALSTFLFSVLFSLLH